MSNLPLRVLIAGLGFLQVDAIGRLVERVRIERLRRRLRHCGRGVILSSGFSVEAPSTVSIEDNVSFGPGVSIMGVGGCLIGTNAMIAARSIILTTGHDRRAPIMKDTGIHKPVVIEDNVWIGAGAIVLPGVAIRTGAVVAAGAVVTREVPQNQVVAGVPARALYDRFS